MIQISRLTKSYNAIPVLNGIDLRFEKGQVYGIVGENGAGKTTLFRCVAGLETFEGEVISDASPLKDQLGFLPADPYFLPKITGEEYIRLMCSARSVPVSNLEQQNIFDLPLDRYASTYSTGMKKKLAIMAILLQKNNYLILDEPFNGVDIQSNILITEIIQKLKEMGKTLLISSHIFSTLQDTCDEIHLLKNGLIAASARRDGFSVLETAMKESIIGDRIGRIQL
jgi:ABC-2 type transport system ATP-binding protein